MSNFYHKISDKRLEMNGPKDGFISSSDLSNEFGYDVNHISLLARQGKVDGVKRNGFWFVRRASLVQYKNKIEQSKRSSISTPTAAKDFAVLSNAPSHQAFAPTATRLRAAILAMVALLIGASVLSAFDNPPQNRDQDRLANIVNRDLDAYEEFLSHFENHKNNLVEKINLASDKIYFALSDFGESEIKNEATILSKSGNALLNNVAKAGEVSIFITGEIIPLEEIQRIERTVNETVNRVETIENRIVNISPGSGGTTNVTNVTNVSEVTEVVQQIIDDSLLELINSRLTVVEEGLSQIPPPLQSGGGGTIIQTLNPDIVNAGQVNVDDDLRLDGATLSTITSNLTLDSAGGTTTINDDVAITGDVTISGSCTGCGSGGSVSSNSLDFDEFVDSMTLDANLTVASAGFTANWAPHFASDLKPSATGSGFTLGENNLRWDQLYLASGDYNFGGGAGSIHIGSSAEEAVIDFDTTSFASSSLAFYVNPSGDVDFIISDDYYVGVGTATPRTLSDVVDNTILSDPLGTFDLFRKALVFTGDNDGTNFSWALGTDLGNELFIFREGVLRATFEQDTAGGFGLTGALNAGNPQARSTSSYSRFGTDIASNSLSGPEDVLISGALEVSGNIYSESPATSSYAGALLIDSPAQLLLRLKSSDGDGTQAMWDNTTAGQQWSIYTVGTAGVTSLQAELGSFAFVDSTDDVTRMVLTRNGYLGVGTGNPTTVFEAQGTASASYGLFGALQVAGFSSTSYSRFGTGTTGHSNYISSADDLFISGDLEVRGTVSFGGNASISGSLDLVKIRPSITASIAGAGAPRFLDTAQAIDISGRYAYVLSLIDESLTIIDISNSASPSFISSIQGSGAPYFLSQPTEIKVVGKYAYVLTSSADFRFVIFDISDPNEPRVMSALSIGSSPGKMYISGHYAYITILGSNELSIIDISNPANPQEVSSISGAGSPNFMRFPIAVSVANGYAYVATRETSGLQSGLTIIDVSDPTSPFFRSSINAFAASSPSDIYVSGNYAYFTTTTGSAPQLTIFNVADPDNPYQIGALTGLSSPQSVTVSGDFAYVTDFGTDSLIVIDVTDRSNPQLHSTLSTADGLDGAIDHVIIGKYAYVVTNNDDSLTIVDIGGIDTPTLRSGDLSASSIDIDDSLYVGRDLYIGNGAVFGGGLLVNDGISISVASLSDNTASISAADLFRITNSKGRLSGNAFRVDIAENDTQEKFTGNFQRFTLAGNDIFLIDSSGAVVASGAAQFGGIATVSYSRFGTSTTTHSNYISTSDDLLVSGDLEVISTGSFNIASASKIFVGLTSPASATSALCHSNNGAQSSGEEIQDCNTTVSADYQEIYPVNNDVEWGDIVVPEGNEFILSTDRQEKVAKLVKSSESNQSNIIGVASNPNDSGDFNTIGYNIPENQESYPIALNGRVMTKVNLENGPIAIGDRITTSSIQGVGMKATDSGMVLGIALESLDPPLTSTSHQRIMVFINPHWYGGSSPDTESLIDEELDEGVIFDLDILFSNIVKKFYQMFNILFSEGSIETENIKANQQLCVGSICINESDLQNLIDNGQLSPSATPVSTTPSPTPSVSPSPTPEPSVSPIPDAETPTPTPEITPTPEPTPEITPTPTPTPEATPEITPTPTPEPTPEVTPEPTEDNN